MERYSGQAQYKAGAAPLGFRGVAAPAGCVTSHGGKRPLPLHGPSLTRRPSCFTGDCDPGCPVSSYTASAGLTFPEPRGRRMRVCPGYPMCRADPALNGGAGALIIVTGRGQLPTALDRPGGGG